jgi:hypothetical protein
MVIGSGQVVVATETAVERTGRFVISSGKLAGLPDTPPITILLDSDSGRTWMLGVVDGSPRWLPLVFGPLVPDGTLPPSALK